MNTIADARAFPRLSNEDIQLIKKEGKSQTLNDGEIVYKSGDKNIDFVVVLSGKIAVINPLDSDKLIVVHEAGEFTGDIDLLTQRPALLTLKSQGTSEILRVTGDKLRHLLGTLPHVADILLVAFHVRRQMVTEIRPLGLKVIGATGCPHTNLLREFLHKNFVPFTYYDSESEEGDNLLKLMNVSDGLPVVDCGGGNILKKPALCDVAECARIWQLCTDVEFDFLIIGAGPAGIAAAVYAASEGLKTVVIDKLGPGGQAGGSSKIENFIGFPAGLSGTELSTRGVLQMLKFGAQIVAPTKVDRIEPATEEGAPHVVYLDRGGPLKAHSILIATGVSWRRLEAKNAERFERAGIHYACTSIESRLYEGKDVAVVGSGNSAGQAAMFVSENCATTVHLLTHRNEFGPGMSQYLVERIKATPNIKVHLNAEICEVIGQKHIDSIKVTDVESKKMKDLACAGIFVFIGAEPHAEWLPNSIAKDDKGYIKTGVDAKASGMWPLKDRDPCPLETSIPRIMAGGDVRTGSTKRVGFAVGDGSLAVTCVHQFRRG